jgi:two-component system chemotaxis response regulator CheB
MQVVGSARNGIQAIEAVQRLRPEVVTMDVVMPEMGGLEATRRIMEVSPVPIIIVSSTVNRREVSTTFEALKAGAVAAIPRPSGPGSPDFQTARWELIRTVKAMAEVKVVRRWANGGEKRPPSVHIPEVPPLLVAIGASTGGPETIRRILEQLPSGFALPVLVVQHMAAGFLGGLAEWLGRSSPLPVSLGQEYEPIRKGRVYIAPDDRHMGISPDLRLTLASTPPEKGVRPAVGHLFRSVHSACRRRAVAVLLTGMGSDGVEEMKGLKGVGAMTIAQDKESSVIYGMPGEAVRTGAALYELSPEQIARTLTQIAASIPKERA